MSNSVLRSLLQAEMASVASQNEILSELEQNLRALLNIEKIAPVFGLGQFLERPLGLLRSAAGATQRADAAAALGLEEPLLIVFRRHYGNTCFINKQGQLIAEKPMNIDLIREIVIMVAEIWKLELPEDAFSLLTQERVDAMYASAREAALRQAAADEGLTQEQNAYN